MEHPSVRQQIGRTSPGMLLTLLALYLGSLLALALVTNATLRLCSIHLERTESFLVTAYSSIINFFGPLQSGPAFRAVYLKKKHGVRLKNYTIATFVYYFFYAFFSGLFLLSGLLGWWLIAVVGLVLIGIIAARRNKRTASYFDRLDLHAWYYLALATLLQVSIYALIYYVELKSVMPNVHFSQAIIYAGAANFALFVSLTPGAIGFRESFLVFSEQLHHIGSTTIIAANIIDRAIYILFLALLAVFIFATHAKQRLEVKSPKA
jgi:uncharacterized membrane protein YbhN (UPF0104 family)